MTLRTERVRTLDQVRAFVEGSEAVDPRFHGGRLHGGPSRGSVYVFVRRALVRLDYGRLGKSDKGLVRRYLAKVTGRSRAQPTRLTGQHRETGRIEDRRGGAPAHPFERRYTRADIRLLAVVDAAMGQMSGPATRALMRRQYEMFGDGRFERLAGLSNGHLYHLRRSATYRRRRNRLGGDHGHRDAPGGAADHLHVRGVAPDHHRHDRGSRQGLTAGFGGTRGASRHRTPPGSGAAADPVRARRLLVRRQIMNRGGAA